MRCSWTKRAQAEYKKVVLYIFREFGSKAAMDFVDEIESWDARIAEYPEIGSLEPLLADRKRYEYHSFIVSRHNKLIYIIDSDRHATIVDMWDMRREPTSLSNRIKTK